MRRLLALAAIACAALVMFGVPGCGKKSTQPRSTNQSTIPLNDGTWEVTLTVDSSSGACGNISMTETDTMFIDNGLADVIGDDCSYLVTGNTFTHTCTDTSFNDGSTCFQLSTIHGNGTFSGNTFSGTFTITYVSTPPGCAPFPECVLHVRVSGHRIGNAPQAAIRPVAPGAHGFARLLRRR